MLISKDNNYSNLSASFNPILKEFFFDKVSGEYNDGMPHILYFDTQNNTLFISGDEYNNTSLVVLDRVQRFPTNSQNAFFQQSPAEAHAFIQTLDYPAWVFRMKNEIRSHMVNPDRFNPVIFVI